MWNAVVVDKNYGSVSPENLLEIQRAYKAKGVFLRLEHYTTPEEIIDGCRDSDAILATGNPPITKAVLDGLKNLKVVQRFGIGVNSVDLDAATANGILVMYIPGFCITELAVHATALILNLLRNVGYYDRGIRKGEWRKATGPLPLNPGKMTIGLYGFGGSAREIYHIFANGFGSRILVCDPYFTPENPADWKAEFVGFETMVSESDVISIHAPLTAETRHIFNADVFKKMKKTAMIINIARGELINQEDLIEALRSNEIGFAGLDVFATEPLPVSSPLIGMENVVLTPHSAFYGVDAQQNQISLAIELVTGALVDKCIPKRYIANPDVVDKLPYQATIK